MHATYLHENQIAYFATFKPWGISLKGLYNGSQDLLFACLFVLTVHRSIKIQAFPADWTLTHNFPNTD